ncbi:MAG: protoporphyrinogen oxidase [Chloroflexi bacterium]|nr:protoporphyrinogen oxidase [Chloroflexota bacterium]
MTVLVIGGGITGLVAARELARAGRPVVLIEATARLGGKIVTERRADFLVEHGPDSFMTTRAAAIELCRAVGLGERLVTPLTPGGTLIHEGGRFLPVPAGLALVLPTKLRPLLTTPLLSPRDKARAGLDLLLPRRRTDADESIGTFLRRRFGSGVVEHVAAPLVESVYGADIDELSLLALAPQLHEAEQRHRSLVLAGLALGRARAASVAQPVSPFLTFADGLGELTAALAAELAADPLVELRLAARVDGLESERDGLAVVVDGETVRASSVVFATPAPETARLLRSSVPAAADSLDRIAVGSSLVVNLGLRASDVPELPAGHGFVVASGEGLAMAACSVVSAKWPGRAPAGHVLLRASLRQPTARLFDSTDDAVVGLALEDLRRTIGLRGDPVLATVACWRDAMPRYVVGHLTHVQDAEAAIRAARQPFVLAGAWYRGAGLSECIAGAKAAADQVGSSAREPRRRHGRVDPMARTGRLALGGAALSSEDSHDPERSTR